MFKTTKAAVRKAAPKPKKAKAPLPVARLRELIEATRRDPNRLAAARDVCIFLIMYGGLLRESEVVNLKWAHIKETTVKVHDKTRTAVTIDVTHAKNDQEDRGSQRLIPELLDDKQLCLVTALKLYSQHRVAYPFYFYSVQKSTCGKQLRPATPSSILKLRLAQIKPAIPKAELASYASNSLRKGGATAMFANGGDRLLVKRHGAWRSDTGVNAYITVDKSALAELVESIFVEYDNIESDDDDTE